MRKFYPLVLAALFSCGIFAVSGCTEKTTESNVVGSKMLIDKQPLRKAVIEGTILRVYSIEAPDYVTHLNNVKVIYPEAGWGGTYFSVKGHGVSYQYEIGRAHV